MPISPLPSGATYCTMPDGSRHCTGSQMGRRDVRSLNRTLPICFYLRRERLNNGGYDSAGAYWGLGAPLYRYESVDAYAVPYREHPEQVEGYLRAADRGDARRQVRAIYSSASFFS